MSKAIIAYSETLKAGSSLLAPVMPKIPITYAEIYMTMITSRTMPDTWCPDSGASTPGKSKIDTITAMSDAPMR